MLDDRLERGSPFHIGEQAVQTRLGAREVERWARKGVRDHMPEQHRAFFAGLPFMVAAARDAQGRPWATLLAGRPGFVASPDPRRLTLAAQPAVGDALEGALVAGADLGLLGVEFHTRRRNRVNGRVSATSNAGLALDVGQSFGNCAQHIRERGWRWEADSPAPRVIRSDALSPSQQDWIGQADTFFIASGYRGEGESPTFGMDASHRGGERGFVEILDERRLRFPDFAGNKFFNTVGNLFLDPRAGLLFVDFTTGSLLQLTGTMSIDWDPADLERFPGARRLLTLNVEAVSELRNAVALRWDAEADAVRELVVVDKAQESEDVVSFALLARDGGALPAFEAGQHLPIELKIPGAGRIARTYSLSSAPSDPVFRITVKREPNGIASGFLHDQIEPGAVLASRKPAGTFTPPKGDGPIVLISAGVGVTPMASMLRELAARGDKRPIWFIHGARDGRRHPLAQEIRELAEAAPNVTLQVFYSRPGPEDRPGIGFDRVGRIDGASVAAAVSAPEAQYLICGPDAFMAAVQAGLEAAGTASDHIHVETFGAAG